MTAPSSLDSQTMGRSPYEVPDNETVDPSAPVRRVSEVHADNYMQEYDARGHPVNTESRTMGKALRRAKNDILSTMGIVVSREDRNAGTPNEQQKLNQIASENDFGLVITTLDQLFIFFGTWWTSSLTGRVQTYKYYAHSALMSVIQSERDSSGILNFYFAGIPAWAMSSGLAIAREGPLKRIFVSLRDYAQHLTGESRASLSLVSPYSIPGLKLLLPFGTQSLLQLPTLPADLSLQSLGISAVGFLTSPSVLVFLYGYYLRPQLEERIYRLIRRRLPKPSLPDELSVRVAYEENLIEWVVPSLGRRSDEELHRSKLTLFEDIKCELGVFRRWVSSLFGLISSKSSDQQDQQFFRDERIESLRNSFEMLRHDSHADGPSDAQAAALAPSTQQPTGSQSQDQETPDILLNQVLTNENRMSQSPGEISNDYFSETATAGRANGLSTTSNPHNQTSESQSDEVSVRHRQNSRSNTLFSRPSSPETSPPTSPRVRASLIHQNSDLVTMQLELLGNRSRSPQIETSDHTQAAGNALTSDAPSQPQQVRVPMDDETMAQVVQAMSQALSVAAAQQDSQRRRAAHSEVMRLALGQALNSPQTVNTDGAPNITARAPNTAATELIEPETTSQNTVQGTQPIFASPHFATMAEAMEAIIPNILPDGVEEPNDEEPPNDSDPVANTENDDTHFEMPVEPTLPSSLMPGRSTSTSADAHRVTLLSAYPVDSLASHLAAAISGIILAPIESLYLRSLTQSWLIANPSSTPLSGAGVHPLGLWFGGRTWSDIGAYTCRLVLMRGMQVAMRAGIWGFLVGSTMRIGRNFCGWGKL
ncbi:hypothetical protein N7541_011686 [Penicillium brevicompactum]|uniref:Uncharacterized protein n=1 Tax=Penicillium brevicompactum TaxID=5074 RepID=A0A9W9UIS4_PENBR|nr:hypothetical protein N7541_011686 [Penicillium brevicompactum]